MTASQAAFQPPAGGFFSPGTAETPRWPFPGCDPLPGVPAPRARRRYWRPEELELLADMYPECHTEDVAAWLQRPLDSVYHAANVRGMRKSAEYLASDASARIQRGKEHPNMIASRFQPGHTRSWNKGTKGVSGTHPNTRRTQFRSGNRPHTWQPVGTYRILKTKAGPILELKTSDRPGPNHQRWEPVSRLVWVAAHGPVPAGHIVVFRRGMSTTVLEEITPDRLECITRAEHAQRNHPRNHSPELARLVQLKGAITRQVNRIAREAEERTSP